MKKILRWLLLAAVLLGVLFGLFLAAGALVYSPEYVLRILLWQESEVRVYLYNFPQRALTASPNPFSFGEAGDAAQVARLFEAIFETDDLEAFMEETHTQAFIVIHKDAIQYEGYFNGTERETLATSFSMAKSFTSALIGIAIQEGHIGSVDDPVTRYLPELAERDARFAQITIRHLLLMASGLDFQADRAFLFNGDDALTTYYPDQRRAALTFTQISDPPEAYFLYNKYHPQLLGMVLERATGTAVTTFLQEKIWSPVGMAFDGSWSLDSTWSGFEKMETGVNARPIDFAKFGRLFLRNGNWEGTQVVATEWVAESTGLDPDNHNPAYYPDEFGQGIYNGGRGYYKYMWYGLLREGGRADFFALGDRGQLIYASPQYDLVIVRNGFEYGIPAFDWPNAFYRFAEQFRP